MQEAPLRCRPASPMLMPCHSATHPPPPPGLGPWEEEDGEDDEKAAAGQQGWGWGQATGQHEETQPAGRGGAHDGGAKPQGRCCCIALSAQQPGLVCLMEHPTLRGARLDSSIPAVKSPSAGPAAVHADSGSHAEAAQQILSGSHAIRSILSGNSNVVAPSTPAAANKGVATGRMQVTTGG